MSWFMDLIHLIRDPGPLLAWGYPGLFLVIFAETGAMTFFLPGDSLLFTAGVYASDGRLNILLLNLILIPAAIIGDATSYWIGLKTGPRLFNKPKSRWFNPDHVKAAHAFYEKHGGKAIILARFMPLVRTFVPVIAGIGNMGYIRFATFNIIGGAAWVLSMTFGGYFLGQAFPWIGKRIEIVIIVIVLLSISPAIYALLKSRSARKRAAAAAVESKLP
jgi:membrane-associated protein